MFPLSFEFSYLEANRPYWDNSKRSKKFFFEFAELWHKSIALEVLCKLILDFLVRQQTHDPWPPTSNSRNFLQFLTKHANSQQRCRPQFSSHVYGIEHVYSKRPNACSGRLKTSFWSVFFLYEATLRDFEAKMQHFNIPQLCDNFVKMHMDL